MPEHVPAHKQLPAGTLQLVFAFAYAANPDRAAAPEPAGSGYQDALVARVAAAFCPARPYALSLAARTDRGVAAEHNVLSLRLRGAHLPSGRALAAALARVVGLEANGSVRHDGLLWVRGWALARRAMARAQAGTKHYRYLLPPRPTGQASAAGDAQVGALLRAFNDARHFARYCEARAAKADKARKARPPCRVQLADGPGERRTLRVASQALLRHQVRHLAGALLALEAGALPLHVLLAACGGDGFEAGDAVFGPVAPAAPAAALTLERVELPPALLPPAALASAAPAQ